MELVAAALKSQERERASGFADFNPHLLAIRASDPDQLVVLIRGLHRAGSKPERELAARLLVQSSIEPDRVLAEVRELLAREADPDVIRWLVSAMQWAPTPAALPDLVELSRHDDANVRFVVPDALSSCAPEFDDVSEMLRHLAGDPDRDVRWSAAFELAAWLANDITATARHAIVTHLKQLAAADPDEEIRELAAAAIEPDPTGT